MPSKNTNIRKARIAAAAYEVLAEKGYPGASMLAIARRAKASNETLYRWYGDKNGLFASLVEANAQAAKDALDAVASQAETPRKLLETLGPTLYGILTSEHAIALNRAAAADPTGTLGRAIAEAGREIIAPRVGAFLVRARNSGLVTFGTTAEAVSIYLDLLVGDRQIRRAMGTRGAPDKGAIEARAKDALARFLVLFSPGVYNGWQASTADQP